MAYKIMQRDKDGVLREVVIRGETVRGADFNPADIELKQFDDETRSFTAVGSTGNPDRVEDIINQNGWMWAHDYSQLPIFRATDLEIKPRAKKMIFRASFDDFEFADNVYQSYLKGFMKGFSVGFLPLKYEQRDRDEMTEEEKQRAGWWGGMFFDTQELLEISAAPIPMHPEALADIKSMGIPTEFGYSKTTLTPGRSTMNDGSTWVPIDDVNLFTDLASVTLDNGVKAVSGKPVAGADDVIISPVVGYIFPSNLDNDDMVEWLVDQAVSEEKACALVTDDLDRYLELMISDEGDFKLLDSEEIEEIVEEVEEEAVVDDDIGKTELDKPGDKFVIIPEGAVIEEDGLHINTSIGSFTLGLDILKEAGLEIREDELVDVRNRDSLDNAVNTLTALLKDVKIEEEEPESELDAQQPDEMGEEDFALMLTLAEELKDEIDVKDIDAEMFRSVLTEVLQDNIGGLVKSSLTESLKVAVGDFED
jgi:hypothetical protein